MTDESPIVHLVTTASDLLQKAAEGRVLYNPRAVLSVYVSKTTETFGAEIKPDTTYRPDGNAMIAIDDHVTLRVSALIFILHGETADAPSLLTLATDPTNTEVYKVSRDVANAVADAFNGEVLQREPLDDDFDDEDLDLFDHDDPDDYDDDNFDLGEVDEDDDDDEIDPEEDGEPEHPFDEV